MQVHLKPTLKQAQAWLKLRDNVTNFIVFGGGAGGGKSWLGAEWLLSNCFVYPGTKWFIGREELKRLMSSSYLTFVKVCKFHQINSDLYKLNGQYNYIKFENGSTIDLLDLKYLPGDPLYERFGSLEYTGGWIEEGGEVDFRAFDMLKSRIGRHMNKEYNILPKMFITCNPKKNWLYYNIYKKWQDKTLPNDTCFIQSLYGDNPHTSISYGSMLAKISDNSTRQRLMFGNWDYENDPTKLFEYDKILDLFTNSAERGKKYLTIDVAGRGRDHTVLTFWDGLFISRIELMDNITAEELDKILLEHKIPRSQCLVDEDGVGFGLVNELKGVKGFVNNSSPIKEKKENDLNKYTHNYKNLKAQCWFYLADLVAAGKIGIYRDVESKIKNLLIEDLEQIKRKDPDKDAPLQVLSKEDIKLVLQRSTDIGDTLMMRMYFEIKTPLALSFIDVSGTIGTYEKSEEELAEIEKRKKETERLVSEGKISFGPKRV